MDDLAKSKGVTAVVDCEVAPGLCNVLCGHLDNRLDRIEHYACYVGGLPAARKWPYEYKTVFSPTDVIEKYIRPSFWGSRTHALMICLQDTRREISGWLKP